MDGICPEMRSILLHKKPYNCQCALSSMTMLLFDDLERPLLDAGVTSHVRSRLHSAERFLNRFL